MVSELVRGHGVRRGGELFGDCERDRAEAASSSGPELRWGGDAAGARAGQGDECDTAGEREADDGAPAGSAMSTDGRINSRSRRLGGRRLHGQVLGARESAAALRAPPSTMPASSHVARPPPYKGTYKHIRVVYGSVLLKMACIEVCESCSGIFPTSDFVMAFFQLGKVAVA